MTLEQDLDRILVVDDQEDIIELLGEYLRTRGLRVVTCNNGKDAIEILHTGEIDIMLTDLKMPVVNGIDLLTEARGLDSPVGTIVMTGYATVETAIYAMKEGAYDYVVKPFKLRDIHASLERASSRLAAERAAAHGRVLLQLYERSLKLSSQVGVDAVLEALAHAGRVDTQALLGIVWHHDARGWHVATRSGQGGGLGHVKPGSVSAPRLSADGVAATPIRVGDEIRAVIAVAGGAPRVQAHLDRLVFFSGVVGDALSRLPPEVAPSA